MVYFRFLDQNDVCGTYYLKMLLEISLRCKPTDLTVLLGGSVSKDNGNCNYWMGTPKLDVGPYCVNCEGDVKWSFPRRREVTSRPLISLYYLQQYNGIDGKRFKTYFEHYAGEYPQTAVDKNFSAKLDKMHKAGLLKPTGKSYTFDSLDIKQYDLSFRPRTCPEYSYADEKYISLKAMCCNSNSYLANGEKVEDSKNYWVKVEPIKWLVDDFMSIAISEKALFAGVQMDNSPFYHGLIDTTTMYDYLNIFGKEIFPRRARTIKIEDKDKGFEMK